MARKPERRRWFRELRRRPGYAWGEVRVLGFLIWVVLWALRLTTRFEKIGVQPLETRWDQHDPVVFAFWHGRSIMLPFLVSGRRDAYIMNSTHRDGEIITRALGHFGIRSTRGSSSRNAVAGTLALWRALRGGNSVALIPDGPRGPAGVAKPGAVELAARAEAMLFPLAFSASRAVRFGGWDRMMLPLPGAKVVCVVGEPIVATTSRPGKVEREEMRLRLETRLNELTARADRLAGREEEPC
jgi:lysophospholipid acyltransferase (LPLAT)-like uncharacterized protein